MENKERSGIFPLLIATSYVLMIVMNALASLLPINGKTTGEVSDSYPNLFAPPGITFAVWGVIYLLLAGYVVYQFIAFSKNRDATTTLTLIRVGVLFVISSIFNIAWIVAWHFDFILISTVLIIALLICLILIALNFRNKKLPFREKLFVRLPFSIYFGWITVAVIANITILLVDIGWNQFGLPEALWTVLIILVGAAIASATMVFNKDYFYILPVAWAYVGIIFKHIDADGFNRRYPTVYFAAAIGIAMMFLAFIYSVILRKLPKHKEDQLPESDNSKDPSGEQT